MRYLWIIFLGVGMLAGSAMGAPSDVEMQVFANRRAVTTGDGFEVAVVLTTNPGWHIYWKNSGEAGLATKVEVEFAGSGMGSKVGAVEFPLPTKFVEPGGIVDFGYTGRTVFLVPVVAADRMAEAMMTTIVVKASWLCCKGSCVPGHGMAEVKIGAGRHGEGANEALFEAAHEAMPMEMGDVVPGDVASMKKGGTDSAMELRIEWKEGVSDVDLFPLAMEGLEVSGIKAVTEGGGTRIGLATRVMSGAQWPKEMPVLIVYKNGKNERRGFYTDLLHLPG